METLLLRSLHTDLLTVPGWRQQIEIFMVLWLACQDHPSVPPGLHWTPTLAPTALLLLPAKVKAAIANKSAHTWREQGLVEPWPCL